MESGGAGGRLMLVALEMAKGVRVQVRAEGENSHDDFLQTRTLHLGLLCFGLGVPRVWHKTT